MKTKLYVEGGGGGKDRRIACTRGFNKLLAKAGFEGRMPATVACGSRNDAFDRFKTALSSGDDRYPMLLVDSEAEVRGGDGPWSHLARVDGWARPEHADDDQAQLMVQCMETWCVADRKTLRSFFGQHLQERALPPLDNLEGRSKDDVQRGLKDATRKCGCDRKYEKGRRSFELLAELDPDALKETLPHFARLCECLDRKLLPNSG